MLQISIIRPYLRLVLTISRCHLAIKHSRLIIMNARSEQLFVWTARVVWEVLSLRQQKKEQIFSLILPERFR